MGRLAIVAATNKELQAAVEDAPGTSFAEPVAWRWRGVDLYLLRCGMGPVNAAFSLGRLLQLGSKLRGVINLGIAGSFRPEELPLLQPVVVGEEIWPEFGLRTADGVDASGIKYGQGTLDGETVRDRVTLWPQRALTDLGFSRSLPWPIGTSLTVAGATGDAWQAERYRRSYTPDLENMEGFALAWPCLRHKVPFAEVRCISNVVGSRQKADWDIRGALNGLRSVMTTLVECMG